MTMPRHGFPALLAALLLPPCHAQQEAGNVSLRFLSFPRAVDPAPLELLVGEGKTIEVGVPTNELSSTYHVKRQSVWAVGETVGGKDGKPVFKVFGQTPALASAKQILLLIRKGEMYSDGFHIIPVDDQGTGLGGGKFLFLNAAKIDIAGVIGQRKFAIKPGQHVIVKAQPEPGLGISHVEFWYRGADMVKPFFSSTWPVSERARCLVFFYHDPASRHLRLHSIRDFP
jgi:hypothetical protein